MSKIEFSAVFSSLEEGIGFLLEQDLNEVAKISTLPSAVFNLLIIKDLLWKFNDGGVAEIFNYTEFEYLTHYQKALAEIAPIYISYFNQCFTYLKSLKQDEIGKFYALGMFHDGNEKEFYVRDKLNFLGKAMWKQPQTLEECIQNYVDTNSEVVLDFCKKNNLNLESKKSHKIDDMGLPAVMKYRPKKIQEEKFVINDGNLSWSTQESELNQMEEIKIKLEYIESVNIDFSPLKSCKFLQISGKELTQFPTGFGVLKNLNRVRLILSKVENISNLEDDLLQLPNLEFLEISNNQLSEIPDFLCQLKNIKELNLSCNKLRSIPKSIHNLVNLEYLNCWFNKISYIPEEISRLSSLKRLNLSNNQIKKIHESIYSMVNLEDLSLSSNEIDCISPNIKNLRNLLKLGLFDNYLTDLPEEITELKKLTSLFVLKDNDLSDVSHKIKLFISQFEV